MQNDNNQNKNLNNNINKQKGKGFFFIILLIAVLVIMLIFNSANSSLKQIGYNELVQKIESHEIAAIYMQNGSETGKVLLKENADNLDKFPSKADYWFVVNTQVQKYLYEYLSANPDSFELKEEKSPINWSSVVMPILYIVILLVTLYLLYRMFARGGKGIMGFGKNKMKSNTTSNVKFENVAGIKEEKEELVEIVDYLKNPKKYVSMGARIPKGVLLVGQPGTGKTLLAKAIAGESGVPFYSISGSDFVEMYVGVGASRVRELFEEAKKNLPCIVFIDEIDAVGRMRGVGLGGGNDEREQTLNQLLVEMDGFDMNEGLIVMAATNRVDILDPALTRPGRFDRRIHVYPPDVKGRQEILEVYAKNKPLSSDVDMRKLARVTGGFTGADLENLLNEAALTAAKENKPTIEMEDILNCVNKVRLGLAKTSREVTEKTKLRTAYHESGHAILAKVLDTGDLQEISIIPRGFAGGYTATMDKDESSLYTKNQLNNIIAQTMGGRIAEFLQFQDVSVGAENDIRQATEIARRMVTDWGMSEKLGFIAYNNEEDMFSERRMGKSIQFSESITSEIDNEVRDIINANYANALKILQDNKKLLDEMAKLLMDRETIYAYEVDELFNGKSAEEVIKTIEEKENEKKQLRKQIEMVNKFKQLINQKQSKLKGLDFMIEMKSLNEEQVNQLKVVIENEYEKEVEKIKEECIENDIDYAKVYEDATKQTMETIDTALDVNKEDNEEKQENTETTVENTEKSQMKEEKQDAKDDDTSNDSNK